MLIEVFNPRPFPSKSSNNYGNSYGNKSYHNNRNTSELENNIKEFINAQKVLNTTIEEKFTKIDDMSRNLVASTKVLSIKVPTATESKRFLETKFNLA